MRFTVPDIGRALCALAAVLAAQPAMATTPVPDVAQLWGQLVERTASTIKPRPGETQLREAVVARLGSADERPGIEHCVRQQAMDWNKQLKAAAAKAFACRAPERAFDFAAEAGAFLRSLSDNSDFVDLTKLPISDGSEQPQHPPQIGFENGVLVIKLTGFERELDRRIARSFPKGNAAQQWHTTVIDLRNNTGGLLDVMIQVADIFLDAGPLLSTVGADPSDRFNHRTFTFPNDSTAGRPLIILVDETTENGPEILAAALRDRCRATIMGQPSAGRIVVRTLVSLTPEAAIIVPSETVELTGKRPLTGPVVPDQLLSGTGEDWVQQATSLSVAPASKRRGRC